MDAKERDCLRELRHKLKNVEAIDCEWLKSKLQHISYENILSQKILMKFILSYKYSNWAIYQIFIDSYPERYVQEYINYVEEMSKIEKRYISEIKDLLSRNFDNLFEFYIYFNEYIRNNPDLIGLPKKIIMRSARECLENNVKWCMEEKNIRLPVLYEFKRRIFDMLYKIAVKYGCIEERFDEISYGREEIVKYGISNDGRPCFVIEVLDWRWKQRIYYACSYYQWVASARRFDEETTRDPLYNYYKCFLCRKNYLGVLEEEQNKVYPLSRTL